MTPISIENQRILGSQKPDGNALSTSTTAEAPAALKTNGQFAEVSTQSISKGVDSYAYLDANGQFSVIISKPEKRAERTYCLPIGQPGRIERRNLQIETGDIPLTWATGRYRWEARKGDKLLATRFAEISPRSGNLGETDIGDMLKTPSQFGPDWAVSYGFYDSGSGAISGLTNQDQSYIYVTRNQSNWMGDLAQSLGSAFTDKPFCTLALPGSHDAGMFDARTLGELIESKATSSSFIASLGNAFGSFIAGLAAPAIKPAAINLAMTQKDNITDQLKLGVRYFDFRPGRCVVAYPGIYHQHGIIPGYGYQKFLEDVLNFLKDHPSEIVVVSLNFDGFKKSMRPGLSELENILSDARKRTGTQQSNVVGNKKDLQTSYKGLVAANKRLLFLNQVGAADDATKYDSYNDDYKSVSVDPILKALKGMTFSGQFDNDYTVLQLQGTATGLPGASFAGVVTLSNASSPLLSTKAAFDTETYPWLKENVTRKLSTEKLIVFLNDFVDNALVSTAIAVTKQRVTQVYAPAPDLCFINTKQTPTGMVRIRRSYGSGKFAEEFTSSFTQTEADSGIFQMVDTDLWFIKTKNTESGKVELHKRTANSQYRTIIDLSPSVAAQGWLQMTRTGLWFIRTKGWTNPTVALSRFIAESNYQTFHAFNANIPDNEADNGIFQMMGQDLWFIKIKNTRSGTIELHQRTAMSGYQTGVHQVIEWTPSEFSGGRLQMVGADLWYIQTMPGALVKLHQRTAWSRYRSVMSKDSEIAAREAEYGVLQLV
jgi:hypothetical protein